MESAIQASKVHLLSTDHKEEGEHTWRIPFDPSLKEVTISLSGPGPKIEVRDPLGMCTLGLAGLCFGPKTELGVRGAGGTKRETRGGGGFGHKALGIRRVGGGCQVEGRGGAHGE